MVEAMPFRSIVAYSVNSICNAMRQHGDTAASLLAAAFRTHIPSVVRQAVDAMGRRFDIDESLQAKLLESLPHAAQLFGTVLTSEELTDGLLDELAQTLERMGDCAKDLGSPDQAYNLYEMSYSCGVMIARPALHLAVALRSLAKPERADQTYSALWRYATERLRNALLHKTDWLGAIDSIETALNVWVNHPALQQQLYRELVSVVRHAEGTAVADLALIVAVQSPPEAVSPLERQRWIAALMRIFNTPVPADSNLESPALAFYATVRAQSLFDDLRLSLMGAVPPVEANISWHDLTLEHRQLIHAVPLGRALIVDPQRTGQLTLGLVHEITHAYCLLGPVGWAQRALRTGVSYLEMLMSGVPSVAHHWPNAVSELPRTPVTQLLAATQLAVALRSEMLIAVWTPWLEGVALYLELLCDPKDDPTEILTPFLAVRSLIDVPDCERQSGETHAQWVARRLQTISAVFETFYSSVCRQKARLRHLSYFKKDVNGTIYMAGYLLARSVVARWEQALGRRLPPVRAAKLLIDATRNGSMQAIAALDTALERFPEACSEAFARWLSSIACLDREAIESFLQPVEAGSISLPFSWTTGRPQRQVLEDPAAIAQFSDQLGRLSDRGAALITDACQVLDGQIDLTPHHQAYLELFDFHNRMVQLLPVGRDHARLLISADGRVTICARTYAGVLATEGDLSYPRYSTASYPLEHEDDARALRAYCAKVDSARVLVTSVIDLAGNEYLPPGSSYVYVGLGSEWNRISLGYLTDELDDRFATLKKSIAARVNADQFNGNQATTLASLAFLADRCERIVAGSAVCKQAKEFQRAELATAMALRACAQAFSIDTEQLSRAFAEQTPQELNELVHHLYRTGWQITEGVHHEHSHDPRLLNIVAGAASYSGVTPFGETR